MIPQSDWKWYGNAAHFICADRCQFHMATEIGAVIVSSVGEMRDRETYELDEIGAGRTYETMVFTVIGVCECGCGLPKIDTNNIDFAGYSNPKDANAGHAEMCEKWAGKQ